MIARCIAVLLLFALESARLPAQELPVYQNGVAVAADSLVSAIGIDVLRQGGNAVDAAVAMGFALAVVYPGAGNIGGGAYLVMRLADGRDIAIDGREVAPGKARRDMYLDENGDVIPGKSLLGPIASGVPGTVDALLLALRNYGTMSRSTVMAPAIRLAREGFAVHPRLARQVAFYRDGLERFPATLAMFSTDSGLIRAGSVWKQPDLAATLERIRDEGRDGFYRGLTATRIMETMEKYGGIMTLEDLARYRAMVRAPVRGTYRGCEILSMPPSSSGGVALIEILNILSGYDIRGMGFGSAAVVHLMAEAFRRAFSDRAEFLGDPDFVPVPTAKLVSRGYARERAHTIADTATPSALVGGLPVNVEEGRQTTHYAVVDRMGNAVSVTTTINSIFGSKCVVEGAGFLLNNEMDDFSAKPGEPNQFGLIGNEANAIAPGKRMLSSMAPTIVLKNGEPWLVTGSPGGSRIITTVAQVIVNVIDFGMNIREAIAAPRVHHQWLPDRIEYEPDALSEPVKAELLRRGHALYEVGPFGRAEGILRVSTGWTGFSDPRGYGEAAGW